MRLEYLREKHHMSQQRLAMDLHINQNTLSRYENHRREADYATLVVIADYFDVSLDYLMERDDDASSYRARTRK